MGSNPASPAFKNQALSELLGAFFLPDGPLGADRVRMGAVFSVISSSLSTADRFVPGTRCP